jgi:hypothetical protein
VSDLNEVYEPAVLTACGGIMGEGLRPLPPLPLPVYRPIESGRWRFDLRILAGAAGYFRGPQPLMVQIAILSRDGATWMSTTPAEIESQMPHAAVSCGKVVVCGLGLGVMAYAVAARRAVNQVVVVERDRDVVEMFYRHSGFSGWPQRDKIEIVIADARDFRCRDADFLYADIWPRYRMTETIPDMQAIHRVCPAPRCGYWGQELDMVDWAASRGVAVADFDLDAVRAYAAAVGLPLIAAEIEGYAELCRRAAQNPVFQSSR